MVGFGAIGPALCDRSSHASPADPLVQADHPRMQHTFYVLRPRRYEKDVQLFKSKVVDSVKLCNSHLFDQPKIDDPYAIRYVQINRCCFLRLSTCKSIFRYISVTGCVMFIQTATNVQATI